MTASAISTAILVLAPPRSGTSAISHFLSNCGFDFGDPAHFVDTEIHRHNPIFFELEWVNRLNDEVLAKFDSEFKTGCPPDAFEFASTSLDDLAAKARDLLAAEWPQGGRIGIKDPRFCFTLPFWTNVFAELGVRPLLVWSLRSPAATIRSNARLVPDWSLRRVADFWKRCVLGGRHVLGDSPFVMLDYDRMMSDPLAFAADAVARLGIEVPDLAATVAHVSPGLRHETTSRLDEFPEVDELDVRFRAGLVGADEYPAYRRACRLINADADLERLLARHRSDEAEYERLSRERIDLIHSLEGQLRDRTESLAEHQRQSTALVKAQAGHIEKLTAGFREAEERRAVLEARFRDLQDHVERQTAQFCEVRDSQRLHIEKLTAEYRHAEEQRAGLDTRLRDLQDHVERQNAQQGELRDSLRLHIEKLEAAFSAAEAARDRFEHQAADLSETLAARSSQSEELQNSLREHIAKLETMYREAEIQRSGLQQENTYLAQHLELKNRQSTEFQESQRRHIEKLEALYSDTERRRAWLAQEAAQNTAEIGRLRDAIAEMKLALAHREELLLEELERSAEQRGAWLPFGNTAWADGLRRLLQKRPAA